jgi:hypothetical protein
MAGLFDEPRGGRSPPPLLRRVEFPSFAEKYGHKAVEKVFAGQILIFDDDEHEFDPGEDDDEEQ